MIGREICRGGNPFNRGGYSATPWLSAQNFANALNPMLKRHTFSPAWISSNRSGMIRRLLAAESEANTIYEHAAGHVNPLSRSESAA